MTYQDPTNPAANTQSSATPPDWAQSGFNPTSNTTTNAPISTNENKPYNPFEGSQTTQENSQGLGVYDAPLAGNVDTGNSTNSVLYSSQDTTSPMSFEPQTNQFPTNDAQNTPQSFGTDFNYGVTPQMPENTQVETNNQMGYPDQSANLATQQDQYSTPMQPMENVQPDFFNQDQSQYDNQPQYTNNDQVVIPSMMDTSSNPQNVAPPQFNNAGTTPPPPPSDDGLMVASFNEKKSGGGLKTMGLLTILLIVFLGMGFALYSFVLPLFQGTSSTSTASKPSSNTKTEQVTLEYWGLWEPNEVWQQVINDFETENPNIKISYKEEKKQDYRLRLQTQLATGGGPDIFRMHNTWLPMFKDSISPSSDFDLSDYFPVINKDVTIANKVFAVPIGFDTLALYYNPDMLTKAGVNVPTTWTELENSAKQLRIPADPSQPVQVAGIALGSTKNIDNYSDIIGLLLFQQGAVHAKPNVNLTADTLRYYSLFKNQYQVWDDRLPQSTYAFATEKVAMVIAPSWRAFEMKQINPNIKFKTAPIPQLPGSQVAWATYWVEGVSKNSKHSEEAWKFLKYLSQDKVLTKLYEEQSKIRAFGEPYPKMSLAKTIENDPVVGAFVKQGSYAQSWYMSSNTHDDGLNDKIIQYYQDALNSQINGQGADTYIPVLQKGIDQALQQYGIQVVVSQTTK